MKIWMKKSLGAVIIALTTDVFVSLFVKAFNPGLNLYSIMLYVLLTLIAFAVFAVLLLLGLSMIFDENDD